MKADEIGINSSVEVIKGLWKGTKGFVEAMDPESSVIVIRDWAGNAAYAFKDDVKRVKP
jgi:ribosomal protein L24